MTNVQVTHSRTHQARCDVALAAHPSDPARLVVAAKHVSRVSENECHVDVHYSADAGTTWTRAEALALPGKARGTLSPSLVWDNAGNLFLAVAAWSSGAPGAGSGIYVYKSTDRGANWSLPTHVDVGQDFPALARDPRTGDVYLVGWKIQEIRCARTSDSGATWVTTLRAGSPALLNDVHSGYFYDVSPASIAVGNESASSSTVLVTWFADGLILGVVSTDGGLTFSTPARVGGSNASLPHPIHFDSDAGFPKLGDDRKYLAAPSCAALGRTFAVAWVHTLANQLMYRVSSGAGASGLFSSGGEAELSRPGHHCFNPQLACAADGTVGCAFYQVERSGRRRELIDVHFVTLPDEPRERIVTDDPWRPSRGAYEVHGHTDTFFVCDPIGLSASSSGRWHAVWPDTRSGTRELWADVFDTPPLIAAVDMDVDMKAAVWILFGVIQDGGGFTVPGGPVPPWGPREALLLASVAHLLAEKLEGKQADALRRTSLKTVASIALGQLSREGASREELLSLVQR